MSRPPRVIKTCGVNLKNGLGLIVKVNLSADMNDKGRVCWPMRIIIPDGSVECVFSYARGDNVIYREV